MLVLEPKHSQIKNHDQKGVIENALKKAFAPEFLNRIDDVVLFNSLDKADIHKIIDIELDKLLHRILDLGYTYRNDRCGKRFSCRKRV